MPTSSRTTLGLALFVLLAVLDISWLFQVWAGVVDSADAPPTVALVLFALVGAVTLATAQPARRGNRAAAWTMSGSRVVSILLADLPAIFLDAPAWIVAVASVAIALSLLGLWWTAPLLGRAPAARAA